jgi:hypothetical protein
MVWCMVLTATFNNTSISVISWQSVLLVEETGVPRENHRPVASHWQTLSFNVVSSTPRHERAFAKFIEIFTYGGIYIFSVKQNVLCVIDRLIRSTCVCWKSLMSDILIINVRKAKLWVENLRKSIVISLLYIYTDNMILNLKKTQKCSVGNVYMHGHKV